MATVFFSYSHADEGLRDQLEKHLAVLKRQGDIGIWHDRRIGAGQEIDREIDAQMEQADIILLLISPDFLASDYCYDREMARAVARHNASEAIVIPVILRPCDWHRTPFGKLNATPPDGEPISQWPDRDLAFLEVVKAIRGAVGRLDSENAPVAPAVRPEPVGAVAMAGPRSSNLRLAKSFTEKDRDGFLHQTFEFIAKFFENSATELQERNPGVEAIVRKIDANRFTAAAYRDGSALARCTVFMGGTLGRGIAYVSKETTESNTLNESLSVGADDQMMFLKSMGMSHTVRGRRENEKLSMEGAAELYWELFIEPLQAQRRAGHRWI